MARADVNGIGLFYELSGTGYLTKVEPALKETLELLPAAVRTGAHQGRE